MGAIDSSLRKRKELLALIMLIKFKQYSLLFLPSNGGCYRR